MNDLVSEFFYEGVRRITPGLTIIVLYWHTEVENVFHAHQCFFSPYLFSACILVIAWLIGFVIDAAPFALGVFFLRGLSPNCKLIAVFRIRLVNCASEWHKS
jgi:ABC-type multidrug transport system permease subunit